MNDIRHDDHSSIAQGVAMRLSPDLAATAIVDDCRPCPGRGIHCSLVCVSSSQELLLLLLRKGGGALEPHQVCPVGLRVRKEHRPDCRFDASVMHACLFLACAGAPARDWVMMSRHGTHVGSIGKFRLWGGW